MSLCILVCESHQFIIMASFLGHHSLHMHMHNTFLNSSKIPSSQTQTQNPKHLRCTVTCASIPARDTIIDFGKYKGRMLGTLPSTYLKWVSNNLRARDFQDWANLADQVLDDPIYQDRVEWEFAERLLKGDALNSKSMSESAVAELLDISNRFGWDNEDKLGWSKIDYELLGTSNGGKIPRLKEKSDLELSKGKGEDGEQREVGKVEVKEKRVERRERLKMKRGMMMKMKLNKKKNNNGVVEEEEEEDGRESCDSNGGVYNPFPGRETLLRKALNRRRID